jgi:YidC/Oxa1 family membrane protein insertase
VDYLVKNGGEKAWQGHLYHQLQRQQPVDENNMFMYTYTGGVLYTDAEKYEKITFDDMAKSNLNRVNIGGWVAMIQHYFLGAWIPPKEEKISFYTKQGSNGRYIIGGVGEKKQINSGETVTLKGQLYIGPKLQDQLEQVAQGLELTVDYGFLTILAKPLYWMLDFIHDFVGNWGWAIIWLTVLIKLVFYKLSETSYKSMAHMRKVQPKLVSMKERYKDDKQGMNQAMMKLYKEEKINPLGGCLPILVQMPVFIALYWMLMESVEMRQAPFMLWIQDLSIADPFFVLPLIMGATMMIQQKLNPTPMDPTQAKVMMVLPIVFTVFFAFFPAGLVLYWVVNNTLSILQQWYITRIVIAEK